MHSAPSVSYPVGRSRNARLLLLALWTSGVGSAAAALFSAPRVDWRSGLMVLSVLFAGAVAWRAPWTRKSSAELTFDGRHWLLVGADGFGAAEVKVALDIQFSLLVYLAEANAARRWIWLDRSDLPERWQDLRRAVYSRAPLADSVAAPRHAVPTDPVSPSS
ncbi:MAG: hypothetical protein WKG52_11885 [Variovorax sp.]